MALPEPRTTLSLDLQLLTNHIGHFILINGIRDLHPGVIRTNLGRHADVAPLSGRSFADCREKAPSKSGQEDALAERLWAESERIVAGLSGPTRGRARACAPFPPEGRA